MSYLEMKKKEDDDDGDDDDARRKRKLLEHAVQVNYNGLFGVYER